jgi:hypothetical protein
MVILGFVAYQFFDKIASPVVSFLRAHDGCLEAEAKIHGDAFIECA